MCARRRDCSRVMTGVTGSAVAEDEDEGVEGPASDRTGGGQTKVKAWSGAASGSLGRRQDDDATAGDEGSDAWGARSRDALD